MRTRCSKMSGAVASRRWRSRSASERGVPPSRTAPASVTFTRRPARQASRRQFRRRGRRLLLHRVLPVRDLAGNSSSERSRWVGPSCRRRKWPWRSRSRLQPKRKPPTQMTGMLGSKVQNRTNVLCSSLDELRAVATSAQVPTSPLRPKRIAPDLPASGGVATLAPYASSYVPPRDEPVRSGPVSVTLALGPDDETADLMEIDVKPAQADVLAAVQSIRQQDGVARMDLDFPESVEAPARAFSVAVVGPSPHSSLLRSCIVLTGTMLLQIQTSSSATWLFCERLFASRKNSRHRTGPSCSFRKSSSPNWTDSRRPIGPQTSTMAIERLRDPASPPSQGRRSDGCSTRCPAVRPFCAAKNAQKRFFNPWTAHVSPRTTTR